MKYTPQYMSGKRGGGWQNIHYFNINHSMSNMGANWFVHYDQYDHDILALVYILTSVTNLAKNILITDEVAFYNSILQFGRQVPQQSLKASPWMGKKQI